MGCEHVWTSSNFTKIHYMYWLHPSWFEVQQFGNLLCLHHQDQMCTHVNLVGGWRGKETYACTYILCTLVKRMLLPYWFAVIKQDGVINCLNPNIVALPSIETSLTIHSQQENSTNTTMKTSNLTKSF